MDNHLAKARQFNMDASTKTCAQVRRAGKNVAQMLIPHELPAFILNQLFYLSRADRHSEPWIHLNDWMHLI